MTVLMERPWLNSYPANVPKNLNYPLVPLNHFLEEASREFPNNLAIAFNGEEINYRQFDDRVRRLAAALAKLGVSKGSRVALFLPNCAQGIISYYAILRLGAIVVQNNPMYMESELEYQLNDSKADTIIVEKRLYSRVEAIRDKTQLINVIVFSLEPGEKIASLAVHWLEDLMANNDSPADVIINPKEDIAILQYTGGTTGVSKGVMLTHFNLVANVLQTKAFMGANCQHGQERVLTVLPLFHVYGMTCAMNLAVSLASAIIVHERFDVDQVLAAIKKYNVTMFPGSPTMYIAVNGHPKVREYNLSSIHTCISGSAPLPQDVKDKFETLTGAKLVDAFGLSEASPVCHSNPVNGKRKTGSMGIPICDTDCRIVDVETGLLDLPLNQNGEIIVSGPQVMKGYWHRPEETALTIKNGWLYTGDVGYMDDEGYCFIVSRKKDVIIAGGYNIYPREVEEVIFEHPKVKEVVVVGVPDSYRGETVKAFIVLEAGVELSQEEIISFCKEKMARFKVPRKIQFLDEIPKSAVGKYLRRVLLEREENSEKLSDAQIEGRS